MGNILLKVHFCHPYRWPERRTIMEGITINTIVTITGGKLLCGDGTKEIKEVSVEFCQGNEDSIFVPIVGINEDGHSFIEEALRRNGAAFTQEHDAPIAGYEDKPWVRVDDTIKAIQQVGAYNRNQMKIPVIAVTGSVGKTTTREMIAEALSAGKNVLQTMGNQNNQVGVPLTLSRMTRDHEAAVLEASMIVRGEIEVLTRMIRPNIAVVTGIGVSHLASLGSQENICAEKMDIVKGLPDDGLVFLNGDDPFLIPYRGKLDKKILYYGMDADCDYRAEDIRTRDRRTSFLFCCNKAAGKKIPVTLGTMGEHNVRNALAALGICHQMGIDVEKAAERLYYFRGQRQRIIPTSRCTLIDDTYNASPDSMKASIRVLASMDGVKGRRIAGLADMLELGENEKAYHYEVGAFIAGQPVDEVAVYGELSKEIIRGMEENSAKAAVPKCHHFDSMDELKEYLLSVIQPEDVLLLKGSNGMKMKEISEEIQKKT